MTSFWLYFDCILPVIWLYFALFLLYFGYILTPFWIYFDQIIFVFSFSPWLSIKNLNRFLFSPRKPIACHSNPKNARKFRSIRILRPKNGHKKCLKLVANFEFASKLRLEVGINLEKRLCWDFQGPNEDRKGLNKVTHQRKNPLKIDVCLKYDPSSIWFIFEEFFTRFTDPIIIKSRFKLHLNNEIKKTDKSIMWLIATKMNLKLNIKNKIGNSTWK